MRSLPTALVSLLVAAGSSAAQDLGARADSVMRVAERAGFSGVVRIDRNGTTILEKGYGLANRAERIPFTPATVVQIGSNTKDFTVVAVLQLQERGRLNVKDAIGKYFPSAPSDKRDITIWQLVTHTAGLPDLLGGDFEPVSRSQLIENAFRARLLAPPGTAERYSNLGYSLLAAIIERVTGQTYDTYVHDRILAPLGLTRTGFLTPGFPPRDLAHGYLIDGTDAGTMLAKPHAADGPYWNLRGNGGMLSTVGDMHAFYTALFETDKLLKPITRALRFNPNESIGLAGSDNVNYFVYERDPEAHVEMIIASTNASMKAPPIRRELSRVLGFGRGEGGRGVVVGAAPSSSSGGVQPPAAVASVITGFIDAFNRDSSALRRYLVDHVMATPDGPTIDERVVRLSGMRQNLGVLTIKRMNATSDGTVEVFLQSPTEPAIKMSVEVESNPPHRFRVQRVEVGGG